MQSKLEIIVFQTAELMGHSHLFLSSWLLQTHCCAAAIISWGLSLQPFPTLSSSFPSWASTGFNAQLYILRDSLLLILINTTFHQQLYFGIRIWFLPLFFIFYIILVLHSQKEIQ